MFLPLATAPFDMVSAAGYGYNVFLVFNVGIFDNNGDYGNGAPRLQSLDNERIDYDYEMPNAKFDLKIVGRMAAVEMAVREWYWSLAWNQGTIPIHHQSNLDGGFSLTVLISLVSDDTPKS